MIISYISDSIYPYNKGGKEKRLFEIATRLAKMGHDVHIYTMHWWSGPEKIRIEHGVTLHAISKHYPMYIGDKRSIKEGVLFGLACFRLLNIKTDVIDVDHMPFFPIFSAWLVCLLRGKKMYGTWHEALTTEEWTRYMGVGGHIASLIERVSIKLPYKIIAASEHTKNLLVENHGRTKNVDVVASGIDIQEINKVKPTSRKIDVLFIGRLVKDKNVDKLIDAISIVAKNNPSVRCVIIGHGIERSNLSELIENRKVQAQVKLCEPLKHSKNVYAYMKKAKVFVLPSTREGFGIVALESLACGTPVITTSSPANAARHLITPGINGSIVSLDAEDIAQSIQYWIKPSQQEFTATNVENYDWNRIAETQIGVYV